MKRNFPFSFLTKNAGAAQGELDDRSDRIPDTRSRTSYQTNHPAVVVANAIARRNISFLLPCQAVWINKEVCE